MLVGDVVAARRILILSDHLMFARGLTTLLSQNDQFQIIGEETDFQQDIKQIEACEPDIIIMDSSDAVKRSPELWQLLQARPVTTVVELSLNNNNICIYQATQHKVEGVEDLISALNKATTAKHD